MRTLYPGALPGHGRFEYSAITRRPHYRWPQGAGLAVYIGFNVEHFAFAEDLGAGIAPACPAPDVLNYSWREYGNRVGAWRCLEMFDQLRLATGALVNTALYDHAPELVAALVARGDELIGHGHSHAERQGGLDGATELELLAETGYRYTLNWCHDDQPTRQRTRNGQGLWAVPYPQALNDIPMIVGRQMDGCATCAGRWRTSPRRATGATSGSPRQAPFAPTWIRWLDSSGGLRRCARAQTQRQRLTTVHGTC